MPPLTVSISRSSCLHMKRLLTRSQALNTFPCYPPPDDKSPGSLIQAWGLEMFRIGFETGFDLADKHSNMEGKEYDEG